MKSTTTVKDTEELPFIAVNNGLIIDISQSFAAMIEFEVKDFLHKDAKYLFKTLRIGPNFSVESIDLTADYFLFTKSLEVKFFNIIKEDLGRETYFFKEKVNSRLEEKFCFLYPQIIENLAEVFIYSVPDFTLLKASQKALDILDVPYSLPENTFGKLIYEFIPQWKDSGIEALWKKIITTGKPICTKAFKYEGSKGTTYFDITLTPVKEAGRVKYLVINLQEVTESIISKKRLEEQNKIIKFQKEQLDTIISGLSDYITLIDKNGDFIKQDRIIEQSGLGVNNIFDKSDHDYIYYDFNDNKIPQEETPIYKIYRGEEVKDTKIKVVIDGKKETYLIGKGKPIYDDNGEVLMYIIISQDITEWIEREKRIKQEKDQLEAIINSMNDAVAIYDKSGKVIYLNEEARKISSFININIHEIHNERQFFDFKNNSIEFENLPTSRVIRGEKINNEKVIIKFNDYSITTVVNAVPVYDSENNFISAVVTYHDISQMLRYEEALATQKDQLEVELSDAKLLQSISMELLLQDNVQVLYEKIIDAAMKIMDSQYASIQMIESDDGDDSNKLLLLAYRGFNCEASTFWKCVDIKSRSACGEALRTKGRVIVSNVKECGFMDGTEDQAVYLNTGINAVQTTPLYSRSGKMVGMISTHWSKCYKASERQLRLLDVVARQAADLIVQKLDAERLRQGEEKLKKQNELLEAVIENMNDALFIMDPEGRYIYQNKRAQDMGYNLDEDNKQVEAIEETQYYYLDGKELSKDRMPVSRIIEGEKLDNVIVKAICGDKHTYLSLNGCPIYNINGDMAFAIACIRDMTDYIKNTETLKVQQVKLVQAERDKNEALEKVIEMKDEFLSLISHEFRTPLNVINTAIQTMNYICIDELTDRTKKYINIIRQNTFRQLRLVNNLLDITRSDAGRIKIYKRNIDIVFLTKSIVESVYTYASQKGVAVTFISSIQSKLIGIDDEKYERILLNLLSNAIKFTPVGKLIVVKLRSTKKNISIEVKDNGIGIPEDKINLIFDRFGQVDSSLSRQAEGAGIGLSLAKRFVEALNGSISVKSKVGKGSSFKIILPDEQVLEALDIEKSADLLDNRLVQTTTVEFSDIYL